MGTDVGEAAEVGETASCLSGDGDWLVADTEVEGQVVGYPIVISDVASKDRLTEVAGTYTLGKWSVEACGVRKVCRLEKMYWPFGFEVPS
jgi:hypothetical protein